MIISTIRRARLYEQGGQPNHQMQGILQFGIFCIQQQFKEVCEEFTPQRVAFLYRDMQNWIFAAQQLCFQLHVSHSVKYPPREIGELAERLEHLEDQLEEFFSCSFAVFSPREYHRLSCSWIKSRNLVQEVLDQLNED